MEKNVRPVVHVPDVHATVEWYQRIGFTLIATYGDGDDGELTFAVVSFGSGQVMFNRGGQPSVQKRREVDLYLDMDNVDEVYQRLENQVELVEGLHDTFYGAREFIIRDINGFWVTFGQSS